MMQSHQRLSQYKIQNYENKIIQRLQKFLFRMFKLNRLISEYRIKVEHAICELKCYKVMGTRWRHPRTNLRI
jgi:hypothetical protein